MFWQIASCAIALPLFLALSRPHEVRDSRWPRIAISLILVWTLAGLVVAPVSLGLAGGVFMFVLLVFLWRHQLAYRVAVPVVNALYGGRFGGGFRPDFGAARSRAADGDVDTAMAMLREELEKDPLNYEGLMLLASAYQHKKLPDEAIRQAELILNNPAASADQKRIAEAMRQECRQLREHLQASAGK